MNKVEPGMINGGIVQAIVPGANVSVDATDPRRPIISATGGGGGGGTGKDRRWNVPAGVASVDEFNDDLLAAGWTRVDGAAVPAANVTWTEAADSLSVLNNGADAAAALHGIVTPMSAPLAVGEGYVTAMTLLGLPANYSQAGLVLANGDTYGAGTQVTAVLSGHAGQTVNIEEYAGWNSRPAVTGSAAIGVRQLFLRLALVAASTWRADISPDGISWVAMVTRTKAFTPTHVGFCTTSYGTTTKHTAAFEFLRRVSGVT